MIFPKVIDSIKVVNLNFGMTIIKVMNFIKIICYAKVINLIKLVNSCAEFHNGMNFFIDMNCINIMKI